ncbi:hypothetical protein D9613_004508 [Agrocybe pediades]|uniref:F-box domain-containing protein n=1 Tax=Agrocybe pediades TaxID=84607 RepID=A0A8H4QK17_9AGAR|nr:hypothetical protein D9613_004508 [Agrocybe pediades]
MLCSHCNRPDDGSDFIDLSQLKYTKSKCPINEASCEVCQEILEAEKNVEDAVARLRDALSRHQHLKTQMNHAHSPIIHALPVELVIKIFYSCFSKGMWEEDGQPVPEDALVPLKIGVVCRTWRQVALSLPELWTVITLRRKSYPTAAYALDQYAITTTYIPRSGALPLYVFLLDELEEELEEEDQDQDEMEYWKMSLGLVAQCSYRWKDVTMELSEDSYIHITSQNLQPPNRHLTLGSECWGFDLRQHKLWQESRSGPYHVTLKSPIMFSDFIIDWKRVIRFQAEYWSTKDCLTLLKNAPQLVTCSFTYVSKSQIAEPQHLTHNSLRELSFHTNCLASDFFDHISLKNMEKFEHSLNPRGLRGMQDAPPMLLRFFKRSRFPLTKLSLDASVFTAGDSVPILNTVPSLIHLLMHFSDSLNRGDSDSKIWMESFFQHLVAMDTSTSEGGGSLLPRLERLEFSGKVLEIPWNSVLAIFADPSDPNTAERRPLKTLIFDPDTSVPAPVMDLPVETVARLISLRDAGINIIYRVYLGKGILFPATNWESVVFELMSDSFD